MITRLTAALAILAGVVLGQAIVAYPTVVCTPLGTLTTNLQLCRPAAGELGWDSALNNNFSVLDSMLPGALTAANGRLLIGNGSGFTLAPLSGTTNQIAVTNGAGSILLSTPQNIDAGALVQFGGLGLGVGPGTAGTLKMTGKLLTYNNAAPADGQLLIGGTAAGNFTAATVSATANQTTVTNGNNTVAIGTVQNIDTGATPQFSALGLGAAAGGAGTLKLNSTITTYNANSAANTGVPFQVAAANLTAQTAQIGATTLFTPAASGLYRATFYMLVTTTGTSIDLVFKTLHTDDDGARTQLTGSLSCATTGFSTGIFIIRSTVAAIQYQTTMTGTCTYGLYVALERLS